VELRSETSVLRTEPHRGVTLHKQTD